MTEHEDPRTVGAYEILEFLGQGGMASVYLARHRNTQVRQRQGGEVAIKVMHLHHARDPAFRARFEREAELGLELSHPNIIPAHDLVIDGPYLAIVMELVRGRLLSRLIGDKVGPIPWDRAWPLFSQILDAVAYAHSKGVVHRDLKPSNFLVTDDGVLKVGDFGVARRGPSDLTQDGTSVGTVSFMAPEQVLNAAAVDHRADIYAMGMVLYVMLAGRYPWPPGESDFRILTWKTSGELPPPTTFCKDIPSMVAAAVQRAISQEPQDRFQSVRAFQEALVGRMSAQPSEKLTPVPTEPIRAAPGAAPPPAESSMPPSSTGPRGKARKGTPVGCIAGLVVAAVLALAVIFAAAFLYLMKPEPAQGPGPTGDKLAARPPPKASNDSTVGRIQARGVLRWGVDTGNPPGAGSPPMYTVKEDGSPDGFDWVIARRVADAMRVPNVEVVHGYYSDLPEMLKDPEKLDLVIAGYIPYQEPGLAWSDPYLEFGLCLVVPSTSTVKTTADLWGKAVGIYDDPAAAAEVNKMVRGYTELVRMEDGYWDAMLAGRFAGFIYDFPFAKAEIDRFYDENPKRRGSLRIAQYNLTSSTYAVMVRAVDTDLLAVVNQAIQLFRSSTDYAEALRTYLGGGESVAAPETAARTHIVTRGETLAAIAGKELGSAERWGEIWALNKDRFPNPHLLEVGDELVLP